MAKAARLAYYFDANVLGLAKVVVALRPDCTYPGDPGGTVFGQERPACDVAPDTSDEVWLPTIAAQGLVILTSDTNMGNRPSQFDLIQQHAARVVFLQVSRGRPQGTWEVLERLMRNWRRIAEVRETPGPWVYAAAYSGLARFTPPKSWR